MLDFRRDGDVHFVDVLAAGQKKGAVGQRAR